MTTLFDPIRLGAVDLPNRIIMAPMTRSRAGNADGVPLDIVATYYQQRASAGLIISEATNVSAMAKGYVRTPGLYSEAQVAGWRTVTDAVHKAGGRIFAQLFHTGRVALPDFLPGNAQPVAPSAIAIQGKNYTDAGMKDHVVPRALELAEIPAVAQEFATATQHALNAGFDGVELHAASGYLVQQFLAAGSNTRTDAYGGSAENRARFLLQALDGMIAVAGKDRVGIKLSPQMPFNGVSEPDAESVYPYVVSELSRRQIAYLHVARTNAIDWHALLRPQFTGPYLAGAGFDGATAKAMLTSGGADAIVFGALFLANPDLPKRLRHDAALNAPDQATFYGGGEKGYIDYPVMAD
jgi:N-ethylmaleimide reductase